MFKIIISEYLVPVMANAILKGKHKWLVRTILAASPYIAKRLKDRLSRDHVWR